MTILKCKMCGGDLNFEEGATVVECEYCGTKQTVPTIDDEKKITLFGRANRLRFACEFDKASGIYESIVADFPTEAEAYWGLVLCKYGIEYVDDPATGKKIPTCHRSSFDSVMEDDNFEQVLENADPIARAVYRDEAKQIEELRRGIIEVSNKEEPYDIFICYKETAENGERTIDSVIAQDVYDELIEKGYRVFFSRITLEDKLGQEYEPYIFAALNSAKIMLAFGTDYEYYNAVWVKNEWSRFLQMIARGEKKTLIPCYKNIDAYDMPKEFARLQAQDMGKVGAMQDLLRGVEKLLPKKESEQATQSQPGKETVIVQQQAQSATVDSLLKRAFMYLEDSDWSNAADYCNRVLDIDPENADAYVGLLMAELQVRKEEELAGQKESFEQNKYFMKAIRFAEEDRKKALEGYSKVVEDYIAEQQRRLEDGKRQLAEKRQKVANAKVFASEDFLFAIKKCDDSKTATTCFRGDYPWESLDIVALTTATESRFISSWEWFAVPVGLKSDGTVVTTGFVEGGRQCNVSNWKDVVALAGGDEYIVGLKSDGTVVATGSNHDGECKVFDWKDIVAIAAGDRHTVGLKSDGTVVATGSNHDGALKYNGKCKVSDWEDIVSIAAAREHTVGLKSDGTVVATGDNENGQCNVSDWRNIVAIVASDRHTVGLKSDGTVVTTDENESKRVSAWKDVVALAAGKNHTVGLKSDGTVVAAGDNEDGQCNVSDWRDIVAIAVKRDPAIFGKDQTVGLKSDGTILATNQKHYEELELKRKRQEQEQAQKNRRQSNLCQHCGGEFKGLLTKKCSVCGKPKDY